MAKDINQVSVTGRVTRDLEPRSVGESTIVVDLPIAVNGTRKVQDEWVDKANFVDVTVWDAHAENCV
ncbi:MAG TPA: single-stranded DNA-binding protein, partial [Phycisphaerae bacterium]|nr:single-stranded DNA-binding protein [Phycisphaerae bacterium]